MPYAHKLLLIHRHTNICQISGPLDIYKPKGIHFKWYLLKNMLNVVSRELSSMRCMLQNPFFTSNFEYVVEPANFCVISSNLEVFMLFMDYGFVEAFLSLDILLVSH